MGAFQVVCYRSCIWVICKSFLFISTFDFTFYVLCLIFHSFLLIVMLVVGPGTDNGRLNRNHATNAYMLHALGITHVVSVGECALVPPDHVSYDENHHHGHGHGHGHGHTKVNGAHGSLWMEEREGRIKVLDIKVRRLLFVRVIPC